MGTFTLRDAPTHLHMAASNRQQLQCCPLDIKAASLAKIFPSLNFIQAGVMADYVFFFSEQSSRSRSTQKCLFSAHLEFTRRRDVGLTKQRLKPQLGPSMPPQGLCGSHSPAPVPSCSPGSNDPAHSCLWHLSLCRRQEAAGHQDLPGKRFLDGFLALSWYLRRAESCTPCLSPCHACDTTATSRCWILACLLFCFFFCSFYLKNSSWLVCSQGCYSALQLVSAVAVDKPGSFSRIYLNSALLGFSECHLNCIHVQPLIYFMDYFHKASLFLTASSKITRCLSEVPRSITTTIGART